MIYILTGPDDFSKNEFVTSLQTQRGLLVLKLDEDVSEKDIVAASNDGDLFGDRKLIKIEGFLQKAEDSQKLFSVLEKSSHEIIFYEKSLDKRKTETKKILADARVSVKDFQIPTGAELKKWVSDRATRYGITFGRGAENEFLERMGLSFMQNEEPLYTLWQVDSELQKLSAYSAGKPVEVIDVQHLVTENIDDNVFKLTNALGDKNKTDVLKHLHNYMDSDTASDEKSKVIALVALLSDQFRSMLMIKDASAEGMPDAELSHITGFSSGRVFIYKKISARFSEAKILEVLKKLEALDAEAKTSDGPLRLQLLMILESLLK